MQVNRKVTSTRNVEAQPVLKKPEKREIEKKGDSGSDKNVQFPLCVSHEKEKNGMGSVN